MLQTLPFLRVDDRLVHGQVVMTWVKELKCREIWVVSDRAAGQPIEVMLLKNSAPPQLPLQVLPVETAIRLWKHNPVDRLLVLTEGLKEIIQLFDGGFPLEEVNIGGMRYRVGAVALNRSVYVTPLDVALLMEMHDRHLPAFLRMLPSNRKVDIYDRLQRKWNQ